MAGEPSDKKPERKASFRPSAIVITEYRVPQPIFVAGSIGVERLILLGNLPARASRERQRTLALERLRVRISEWGGTGQIPAFGRALGVRVFHSEDENTAYDLKGLEAPHLTGGYGGEAWVGPRGGG
jgi:hypothetical protein